MAPARVPVEANQDEACNVPKGTLVRFYFFRFYFLIFQSAAMLCLHFAISPANPQKCRRFASRQPSIAAASFRWKCHADQATVKALPCVVIDRRAQVFQIAAGSTWPAAGFHILPASLRIHFSQHPAAEEIVQATDPARKLRYVGLRGASFGISRLAMSVINCEHIRDIDVFNIADATRGLVLRGDIVYEASSADFAQPRPQRFLWQLRALHRGWSRRRLRRGVRSFSWPFA